MAGAMVLSVFFLEFPNLGSILCSASFLFLLGLNLIANVALLVFFCSHQIFIKTQ